MIFYDFEVFKEDWLAVFIDVTKKKEYVIINNPDELKALYEANSKDIWVGGEDLECMKIRLMTLSLKG